MSGKEQGTKDFRELLLQVKSSRDEDRKIATKALGKMAISGERHVVGPLIRLLSNPDSVVRYNACEAIGKIDEPRAVKSLINLLHDEDQWVRESACRALATIGDARAIEPLLERQSDTFDKVRDSALKSLVSLGCGGLAKAIKDQNIKVLLKMAKKGDPRPIEKIHEFLKKNTHDKQLCTDLKQQLLEIHRNHSKEYHSFLCVDHFYRYTKFIDNEIRIGLLKNLPFYACRKCHRTIPGKSGISQVVAILDSNCEYEVSFDAEKYMVNYLAYNMLFDFDKVEIIRTTDKTIEQFCIKITKDTDQYRNERYSKVRCLVSPNSGISDWSKKILKDVFKDIRLPG